MPIVKVEGTNTFQKNLNQNVFSISKLDKFPPETVCQTSKLKGLRMQVKTKKFQNIQFLGSLGTVGGRGAEDVQADYSRGKCPSLVRYDT